jgi:hypothetical protein
MNTKTKIYWADQMDGLFEAHSYFPELEMMGAGCFVFFFYDLPNGQRLGIDQDCIVLYSADPDCEGVWHYYFDDKATLNQKVIQTIAFFNLIRTSSPLYK